MDVIAEAKVGRHFSQEELEQMIGENPKQIKADLKALKQWVKKQPHLAKTGKQGFAHLKKDLFQK